VRDLFFSFSLESETAEDFVIVSCLLSTAIARRLFGGGGS
jgi:hypothetical protein